MSTRKRGIAARLLPENRVRAGSVALLPNGRSVKAAIDKDAVRHAGRDPEDPGECDYYYLPSDGLLVFDLGGEFSSDQFDGGD
jgi:hypothetical protein